MTSAGLARSLCDFLAASPTPFHAVGQMSDSLEQAGYVHVDPDADWQGTPGGRYYFTRNDSSIIALALGKHAPAEQGINMIGAHTDSPCLKVKPVPEMHQQGCFQLGVEVYGGALLNPWFDRDLSIAGRVSYLDGSGRLRATLVDFTTAVAFIPSLAIHLDREVNRSRSINAQKDLPPLVLQVEDRETVDFRNMLQSQLLKAEPQLDIDSVLDYELCLYDTQRPALIGHNAEFIAGARLDNLLSCFCGLQAMLDSNNEAGESTNRLLVCTDHEEVGSASAAGACGPFLESVLLRLSEQRHGGSQQQHQRMLARSTLLSVDNAHAIHPNFADRHDSQHGPRMNAGPVIKYNVNQRYATNSRTAALFRKLCGDIDVPCQSFVMRSDMACGSTIGPLMATELGVDTLDLGVATLGMHSIRELGGSHDIDYLTRALTRFLQHAD